MNKSFISIHHSAVERTSTPQLYGVNRYHQQKWNMKSRLGWYVGYTYFIDVDGTVTQTRSWNEETVANRGHNCDVPERCDTISICLADNYNKSFWVSVGQEQALEKLIRDIKKHYPDIKVVGHRDLQEGRTCPGANITKENFEHWNELELNDPEDEEKQKEIANLQARLDSLRALLQRILDTLK